MQCIYVLCSCFVDMKTSLDTSFQKDDEVAERKKCLLEVMSLAVMSMYDGAKTRVRWGLCIHRSLNFEVKVCAVATVVCSSCRCYHRKCKKECNQ